MKVKNGRRVGLFSVTVATGDVAPRISKEFKVRRSLADSWMDAEKQTDHANSRAHSMLRLVHTYHISK